MTLSNHHRLFAPVLGMVLSTLLAGGTKASPADVALTLTVQRPPCTVDGPTTHSLGDINGRGRRTALPFSLTIECGYGDLTASLYATGQNRSTASRVNMTNVAGLPGTPAQLWLEEGGGEIPIEAVGTTTPASASLFCKSGPGTSKTGERRICSLTPSVLIADDTPLGETTAVITFTIVQP